MLYDLVMGCVAICYFLRTLSVKYSAKSVAITPDGRPASKPSQTTVLQQRHYLSTSRMVVCIAMVCLQTAVISWTMAALRFVRSPEVSKVQKGRIAAACHLHQ